jgi:hypothetical protein
MKKFTVSILVMTILVSLLGSCASVSGGPANFVTYEGNLLAADVRYERVIFADESLGNVSIGANAYAGKLGATWREYEMITQGLDVFARYYPFGKSFFAGIGFGWAEQYGALDTYIWGLTVVPQLGWKIDIGEEGKFFIQPGLKVPIISPFDGQILKVNSKGVVEGYNQLDDGKNWTGWIIYPYFGIGYAF